jgi:hypothetical protein
LGPGHEHDRAQQGDIGEQQHERPRHPQIDQQFSLQNGIFEEVHIRGWKLVLKIEQVPPKDGEKCPVV